MEIFIKVCIVSLLILLPGISCILYQSWLQKRANIDFRQNPKLRLKAYKFILKKLEDPNNEFTGFCYNIRIFCRKHDYYVSVNSLTELIKHRPEITYDGYWFKLSDKESRIKVIKECISEVKKVIK